MPLNAPPNAPSPEISRLRLGCFQFIAGGSSSMVEVCLMLPLDVIKTRLQLQRSGKINGLTHYNGVFDAFVKINQQEGIAAFWRGLIPPLVSDTPRRAVKFMVFEQTKPFFMFEATQPTPLTYMLAGGIGGTAEGFLQSPFEVIKVTQQANRRDKLSSFRVAKDIVKSDGFGMRGLFRGVTTTMIRNGVFHIVWFGFFCSVKDATTVCKDAKREFLRKFGLGFLSGILGCMFSCPFDVAKSRIQGPQPVEGEIKYATTFKTLSLLSREEGIRGLYRGVVPQMMRGGPASAILLLGYEYVTNFLFKNFT